MQFKVTQNKITQLTDEILNKGEYKVHPLEFEFSSSYTDDMVKVALFTYNGTTYKEIIINNGCDIPGEILMNNGEIIFGVYAYSTENDELVLRYSPKPIKVWISDGSYIANAENSEPITPSELEQYQQALNDALAEFEQEIEDLDLENAVVQAINNRILEVEGEAGNIIVLAIDNTNYQLTATLKNVNGTTISTSNIIDLPLETMVVGASYNSANKTIVLTLKNGQTTSFSVADLVSGLVASTTVYTIVTLTQAEYDNITTPDVNTMYVIKEA